MTPRRHCLPGGGGHKGAAATGEGPAGEAGQAVAGLGLGLSLREVSRGESREILPAAVPLQWRGRAGLPPGLLGDDGRAARVAGGVAAGLLSPPGEPPCDVADGLQPSRPHRLLVRVQELHSLLDGQGGGEQGGPAGSGHVVGGPPGAVQQELSELETVNVTLHKPSHWPTSFTKHILM